MLHKNVHTFLDHIRLYYNNRVVYFISKCRVKCLQITNYIVLYSISESHESSHDVSLPAY